MKRKVLALVLTVLFAVTFFAGCVNRGETPDVSATPTATAKPTATPTPEPTYEQLDPNTEGELTIMMWSGDGTYMEDIGHKDLSPEEIGGFNQAAAYAVAKAFNAIYPNIKINVFAKVDGPDDANGTWEQHKENFKAEYGAYPDLFVETDIPGMIRKGLVADLSIFSDDPLYKSLNPGIMDLMKFGDVQAALPQYLLPWGVYVNKSLAEDNNLDVPEANWTIDEYTDFISQADMENFYGAMDTPFSFITTGTKSVAYSLGQFPDEDYVQLDSDEVKSLVDYIAKWSGYSVWAQNEIGKIPSEVMDGHWWWSHKFFLENKLLTNAGDPWMMGAGAHPDEANAMRIKAADWDIYPRPSTEFVGNTVGIVIDPFSVYNYAMDDGNPAISDEELMKTKIAYTFAAFWTADTRSWEARANQMFLDGETLAPALNDSFPYVVGEEFNKQMAAWYSVPTHKRFQDKELMPGFHYVLELWEDGQLWDVSDKVYPWYYNEEGERRLILQEYLNMWDVNYAGAIRTEPNWADNVKARLAEWDDLADKRFADVFSAIDEALTEFYGK
ncbi:MAG: hypothetical protein R6W99_01440 [Clostridia bacterium]